MKSAKAGVVVLLLAACGAAHAGPHSVTYSQVSVNPGTKVTIAGQEFAAVQVGVRQFTVDKRYAVRWLVPSEPFGFSAVLQTEHNPDPLDTTNATIDGFPAHIEISDGRTYSLTGSEIPDPQSSLMVEGQAYAFVRIQVGDTRLILYASVSQLDQQVDITTDIYRGTSQSTYGKYTDPVALVGTSGLDKWVDYIRVIPLN